MQTSNSNCWKACLRRVSSGADVSGFPLMTMRARICPSPLVRISSARMPAGNPPAYGIAHVSVLAVVPGRKGNIATLDINQVYGTSLYIRNLHSFTGGQEARTVSFISSQDRQNALSQARQSLIQNTLVGLLQSPCRETVTDNQPLLVTWICQFVTYAAPPGKVLHAEVLGKIVILDIVFVARPRILTTK